MSIQIPQPNINASDDRERLRQIQSYLHRIAGQLQWAFDTLETRSGAGVVQNSVTASGKNAENQASTFAGIKNLIIKSADIVNAYYDQISKRLGGVYVAQSDFGTYTQETQLEIQANSQSIQQLFTDTQTISETVNEMYDSVIGTNAYIKTGKFYDDAAGNGVYGLEIGQTNQVGGATVFDKFARFTADRLSFFDNSDVEVAYISDYHLHITNAVVTGALILMNQFEISHGNQSIDFKWLGG